MNVGRQARIYRMIGSGLPALTDPGSSSNIRWSVTKIPWSVCVLVRAFSLLTLLTNSVKPQPMRPWIHIDWLATRATQLFPLTQERLNLGDEVGLELIDSGLREATGQQLPPLIMSLDIPEEVSGACWRGSDLSVPYRKLNR